MGQKASLAHTPCGNCATKRSVPPSEEYQAPLSKTLDKTLFSNSAHHCHGDFLCTVGENMSCSSGQAPHLHPAVGHSCVQASAKEHFLWGGCVPMALLPLPHLPCSAIYHLLHSLDFFLKFPCCLFSQAVGTYLPSSSASTAPNLSISASQSALGLYFLGCDGPKLTLNSHCKLQKLCFCRTWCP